MTDSDKNDTNQSNITDLKSHQAAKAQDAQNHPSNQEGQKKNEPEFVIQRISIKDVSFETPNAPAIFQMDWKPEVNLDFNMSNSLLQEHLYEVVLKITVTVKTIDKVAFLIEVEQAGIFLIKLFPAQQTKYMLESFCPNILFPYAREVISDIVMRGGFPPLYLAPINFDALYEKRVAEEKEKKD